MNREESRTFLGVAKDLLVRLVERGLNMPDGLDRRLDAQANAKRVELRATPLPTVTLAEIYLAQGHRERALETLRAVLVRDASDTQAASLYERLSAGDVPVPEPKLKPEVVDDPAPSLATAPTTKLPQDGALTFCEAVKRVDGRVLIRWSTKDAPAEGRLALQLVTIVAKWGAPETQHTRFFVGLKGTHEVAADAQTIVRVALGVVSEDDVFRPIVHSPELERDESGRTYVWTQRGREIFHAAPV